MSDQRSMKILPYILERVKGVVISKISIFVEKGRSFELFNTKKKYLAIIMKQVNKQSIINQIGNGLMDTHEMWRKEIKLAI